MRQSQTQCRLASWSVLCRRAGIWIPRRPRWVATLLFFSCSGRAALLSLCHYLLIYLVSVVSVVAYFVYLVPSTSRRRGQRRSSLLLWCNSVVARSRSRPSSVRSRYLTLAHNNTTTYHLFQAGTHHSILDFKHTSAITLWCGIAWEISDYHSLWDKK